MPRNLMTHFKVFLCVVWMSLGSFANSYGQEATNTAEKEGGFKRGTVVAPTYAPESNASVRTANSNEIELSARISAVLELYKEQVNVIEDKLQNETLEDQELAGFRVDLEKINDEILQQMLVFQPEIIALKIKVERLPSFDLEQLHEESKDTHDERKVLNKQQANVVLALKDAELLAVRARNTLNTVLKIRRSQFVSTLFTRRALGLDELATVYNDTPKRISEFWNVITVWVNASIEYKSLDFGAMLFVFFIIVLIIRRVFRPFRRWVSHVDALERIPPLQRIMLAFCNIIFPSLFFGAVLYTLDALMVDFGLYRLRINKIIPIFFQVVAGILFFMFLLNAIFAPFKPKRRILKVAANIRKRLFVLGMILAIINGLDYFVSQMILIFNVPTEFVTVKNILSTWLVSFVLILIVTSNLLPLSKDGEKPKYHGWNKIIYALAWLIIIFMNGCIFFGYTTLGHFLAGQVLITGSIIATMYMGFLSARALAASEGFSTTQLGLYLQRKYDFSEFRLDQISFVLSLFINFVVMLVGVPIILLQWGFNREDLSTWGEKFFTGFSIGGFDLSIGRITVALIVFFFLISLTRIVQRWFEQKVLVRTQLDSGVKNSVKSGVGYIGFFIAALVGVSWAGFNLSNLAIIAGALSVGIGFGLQNIVNNFVSGIIMLIERPIKVGDIIAVAGSEGYVRKINVRATELETFDRQSVIIPNSEVINTSVGNWMHKDTMRRIIIPIGVAYGSDVEKVRELLLSLVEDDNRVTKQPAPFVYFAGFGASSLDFELRFFVYDLMDMLVVETDLRFALDRVFRENNIEIPFPQSDLHIRSGLELPKTLQGSKTLERSKTGPQNKK